MHMLRKSTRREDKHVKCLKKSLAHFFSSVQGRSMISMQPLSHEKENFYVEQTAYFQNGLC